MAINNAIGALSFKVLPNEIRKRFNGTFNYTGRDSTEKWVYKKLIISHSVGSLFDVQTNGTGDEFININSSDALIDTDNVQYIIIKNTGFTDANESLSTNVGALITFGGADITPDLGDDDAQTALFVDVGDTIALKVPASEVADWRVISCQVTAGVPSGVGVSGDNVLLEIAAIIDDGG